MSDFIKLRITEKNSVGEYWLHFICGQQEAGISIGSPAGMMSSALLMAASGKSYVPTDAPVLLAMVDALRSIAKNTCCEGCQEARRVAEGPLAAWEATQ